MADQRDLEPQEDADEQHGQAPAVAAELSYPVLSIRPVPANAPPVDPPRSS